MKKLLSLLLCYVFLQAETFALRGGPNGAGSSKLSGSYSGVMTQTGSGSDVGLFLLSAQNAGASTGNVVIFSQTIDPFTGNLGARFFSGTLTGLVNPVSGTFSGLFNAAAPNNTTSSSPLLIVISVTPTIAGSIKLNITPSTNGQVQQISGTASAQSNTTSTPLTYTVSGWQTSSGAVTSGFGALGGP